MSIAGFSSNPDGKIHKPVPKRNISGELDVFEATRYFSDFNEPTRIESRPYTQTQSVITEQRQNRVHPETEQQQQKPGIVTPPVSRRGRKLTSFLNSLFRSAGSKKSKSMAEEEVPAPGWWRRRRRSSVSHLRSTHAADTTSSVRGSCDINAPMKGFDGFGGSSVAKHVISSYGSFKSTISAKSDGIVLVEELGTKTNGHVSCREEKPNVLESLWLKQSVRVKSENVEDGDVDDGCESDSSSDLFELNVCEVETLVQSRTVQKLVLCNTNSLII